MALKRIDWIMWMSLSLGFFLCLCAKLQLFEHICTYMQVYIIFNNFHPFAVLMLLLCVCSLSTNVCFYLCLYANIFNNTHEKKNTFGHFLAIHFLFIILMHYNHIYYLSVSSSPIHEWDGTLSAYLKPESLTINRNGYTVDQSQRIMTLIHFHWTVQIVTNEFEFSEHLRG